MHDPHLNIRAMIPGVANELPPRNGKKTKEDYAYVLIWISIAYFILAGNMGFYAVLITDMWKDHYQPLNHIWFIVGMALSVATILIMYKWLKGTGGDVQS